MILAARAFRSGVVVTVSSLGIRGINLLGLIVLARLLVPADFGAIALALVVVSSTSLFSSVGMGSAIIASPHEPRRVAYHAGLVNLTLGLLLFTAAVLAADPLASLLGGPDLGGVFRWMSVVILLETLAVVPDALLMKQVKFGRRAVAQVSAMIVQMAVAIGCALAGLGVWSLVAGHIAGAAARLVAIVVFTPRVGWLRPQRWDGALARGLLRFGGTAMGTSIVRHFYNNADNVLIGRLFGPTSLGFYSQAYNLTNIPVQSISQVTNAVLLPVYVRVQTDHERLASGYEQVFRLVALATVPLAVGLFLLAPQAVVTLLGEQWRSSIVLLQLLAGMALFRPLSGTTSPLFLAINRPGLNLRTAVVQMLVIVPLALALYPLGAEGVAIAVTATFALGFFFNMHLVVRRTPVPVRPRSLLRGVLPILLAAALMGAAVHGTRLGLAALGMALETPAALAVLVATGVAAYGGAMLVLDRRLLTDLLALVRGRPAPSAAP